MQRDEKGRFVRGMTPWNKGLTTETSEGIRSMVEKRTNKVKIKCQNCGKEFNVWISRVNIRKFCSRKCYAEYRSKVYVGEKHPKYKPKIALKCETCGKLFEAYPYEKDRRFCSRECFNIYEVGHHLSPETEFKRGDEHSKYWKGKKRPEVKNWLSLFEKGHEPWNKGKTKETDERVKRIAEKQKGRPKPEMKGDKNPSKRPGVKKKLREMWEDPCYRQNQINRMKEQWEDPAFKEAIIKASREALQNHPNKPEKRTKYILDKYFPREFGYNGNFELGIMIGGLIPDFVNVNGKKQIIEVFGDVYHDPEKTFRKEIPWHQQEWGRKAVYAQFGYKTLILWEHELVNRPKYGEMLSEEEIVEKIISFTNE